MTQRELKKRLYDLVGEYFADLKEQGNIVWAKSKPVNPNSPMVALTMGPIIRPYRPTRKYVDGIVYDFYPSKTTLKVDLSTKGAPTSTEPGVTARYEDTAVNDLTDFANFINSVFVDHWCYINDVSISVYHIHELTELTNDTSWNYRAMVELEVGFTQGAVEYAANPLPDGSGQTTVPTYSGGRPQEMADIKTGWFEDVEIEYEKEAPRDGEQP